MTQDSHDLLRELLAAMPLDSRQREVLERGVSNMSAQKANKVFWLLRKALTTSHKAVRDAIEQYKMAKLSEQKPIIEQDQNIDLTKLPGKDQAFDLTRLPDKDQTLDMLKLSYLFQTNETSQRFEICPYCGKLKIEGKSCSNPDCVGASKGSTHEVPCCE
jgi:hypothetical protein